MSEIPESPITFSFSKNLQTVWWASPSTFLPASHSVAPDPSHILLLLDLLLTGTCTVVVSLRCLVNAKCWRMQFNLMSNCCTVPLSHNKITPPPPGKVSTHDRFNTE